MSSRNMSLLPWATLHSDSEHFKSKQLRDEALGFKQEL
jgi:hypothetical protein